MAVELKGHGVTAISLWPGAVKTELVSDMILEKNVVESGKFKVHLALAAGGPRSDRAVPERSTSGFVFLSDATSLYGRRNHRSEWEVHRRPGER